MIEYDKDAIVPPYITEYLRAKTVHNDEFMHSLEKYAEENSVAVGCGFLFGIHWGWGLVGLHF